MDSQIEIVTAGPSWDRHEDMLALEYDVLYRDFGVGPDEDWHQGDAGGDYKVAVDRGKVVGCVRLVDQPGSGSKQLRQLAVHPDYRGAGVGRALVVAIEQLAIEQGVEEIWFNARETAFGFYERLGYRIDGEMFISELTRIPHKTMRKRLRD